MIGSQAAISTYYRYSRLIMELLIDHGKVFFRDVPCRCSRAVVGAPIRSRLVVELDSHRHIGSCQVVALFLGIHSQLREMIKCINARTAQYWRVQQHQATSQRVATRAHKGIQYSYSACSISLVHVRSSSFLISANPKCNIADVVALDQGEAMEYHCNTPTTTTNNMRRYCPESKWIRCSQARESPTNEQQAHIHRWLPRILDRMHESQTYTAALVVVVVNSNNRPRCACRQQQKRVSRAHTPQARQPSSLPDIVQSSTTDQ